MSITAWDIKEAAFSSDVKDVEELILTNKGATDIGALYQAVNLRSLSLAFNSLASLAGLSPLVKLQSLNVSHNQLASLKGVQTLSSLVTLNASHNKVVSLAPLSGLSCLADLWLQNNSIAAPGELRALAALPGLQRLAIANNPLAKALPGDNVRLAALRLCPGLRVVDGRPVEAAERTASEELDLEALLACRAAAPGSAPAATPTHGTLGSLGASGRPGSGSRTSFGGDGGKGPTTSGQGVRPAGRFSGSATSNGTHVTHGSSGHAHGLPDSRLPAAGVRRRPRSTSFDSNLNAAGDSGPATTSAAADSSEDVLQAALEAVASFSSSTSTSSSYGRSPGGVGAGRMARSGSGSRLRPPLPGAPPPRPAAQLQGTQFQAVLDALPRFDTSKLPTRYTGASPKSRSSPPPAPVKPPPDAHVVEYEARYPPQRGGGRAVVVRRDGSAAAFWPGGDMAVTVDADYSTAVQYVATSGAAGGSGGDGGDGDGEGPAAAAAPPPSSVQGLSYKTMVMYRAGGVAASWDAGGGFVQYPGGGLMLMYSRSTGSGTCYSPSGDITRRWRDTDAPADASPTAGPIIALPLALAAAASPRPPPPPPPSHIDMQLDPHLGIRFRGPSHSLELYLSCESVRYRFRCGRNTPGEVWEPPPGRGDSAVPGATGGVAPSRTSTPGETAGAGPARWPQLAGGDDGIDGDGDGDGRTAAGATKGGVIGGGRRRSEGVGGGGRGGGGACEAGEEEEEEVLPPPTFLRNLARQGGAGTHRPVGTGGAGGSRSGGSGASTRAPQEDAEPAAAAVGVGLEGIASITAGLQALEEGLQALLKREPLSSSSSKAKTTGSDELGEPPSPSASRTRSPPPKLLPPKAGRRTGGGSGVSAARAIAARAEAAGAADAGAERGSASETSGRGRGGRGEVGPGVSNIDVALGQSGDACAGLASRTSGGPRSPKDGDGGGEGAGTEEGGGEGGGGGRGIDSDVAAQLAAARKLAADSLAAAMAAASAAAAIGSVS